MTELIKAILIILDAVIWIMTLVCAAVAVGMVYMSVYYSRDIRKEADPYERRSKKEQKIISIFIALSCLAFTCILFWGATWIMGLI